MALASSPQAVPLVKMYERLKRIRVFEETTISLFQEGSVPGFSHSYIGQEAVAVGACMPLRELDRVASTHRGHGHILAKGGDPKRMLAEILGKATGYCKGKAGELHIMDFSIGVLGANGIVGAGIPIATGAALADQIARRDLVTICFFGDGATSEGNFSESLNLASIWKLPVVFVCENNLYGEYTPASEVCAGKIHERAAGYGIPGVEVDGQDVVAVYMSASQAIDRARSGEGPTLIEALTYRFHGHVYGEDALIGSYNYRAASEIEYWRTRRDPVSLARARCLAEDLADEGTLGFIDAAILAEMDDAKKFAQESSLPDPNEALEDVFADRAGGLQRP